MNQQRRRKIKRIQKQIYSIIESIKNIGTLLDDMLQIEDEMRDNMPENLMASIAYENSEDASQHLEDAMEYLEESINELDNAQNALDEI